jgi:membrane protein
MSEPERPEPPEHGGSRAMSEPEPPEQDPQRSRRRRPAGGVQSAIRRRVKDLARDVEDKAASSSRRRVHVPLAAARMVVHVMRQYFRDRCPQQASSLSFQAVLSVVPLMAVTLAVLRATHAMNAESALVDFIADKVVPISRVELAAKLRAFSENVTFQSLGLLGLLGTIILAFLMVNTLEGVVNRIWRSEHRRSLTQKFVVFYATATIGPFILATSLYQAARFGLTSGWSGFVFSFGATLAGFFLLNYFLPATKVRARAAFVGSAAATILFELAKHGFSLYVSGFAFERYSGIYGALAVMPLWLVWIYYSWLVVLFGIELTYAVQNVHLIQRLDRRTASSLETEILERVNGVVATRVMVAVCRAYATGDKVLARDAIADRFDLSDDAVDRLLVRLKDAGLVLEVEGDAVGLIPARPPGELTVADVLGAFRDSDARDQTGSDADGPLDRLLRELEEDESRRTTDVTLAELI